MVFRLRHVEHDVALSEGAYFVGRTDECDLALADDPAVSRRHAVFHVTADEVVVEDLGSRNGVRLNGQRVDGRAKVRPGDRITVGSQELSLLAGSGASPVATTSGRAVVGRVALKRVAAHELSVELVDTKVTRVDGVLGEDLAGAKKLGAFRVLAREADAAVTTGRGDDVERILARPLADILAMSRGGQAVYAPLAEQAACFAAKLAVATGKGSWIDYAIELYASSERPAPAVVIDELTGAVRRVTTVDLGRLTAYVEAMRQQLPRFGPADRFLFQRLEGLERLARG